VGFTTPIPPTFHNGASATCKMAYDQRTAGETKFPPSDAVWKSIGSFFRRLKHVLMPLPAGTTDRKSMIKPLAFEEWLAAFPPARAEMFRTTAAALVSEGVIDQQHIGRNGMECKVTDMAKAKRYAKYKLIVKKEFAAGCSSYLPVQDDGQTGVQRRATDKPRAILSPHEIMHIVSGPQLRPATQALHDLLAGKQVYAGGMTPVALDKWINEIPEMPLMACDFSQFDASIRESALGFVHMWLEIHGYPRHLKKFHKLWNKPRGRTSAGDQYWGDVMNCSGRSDTALINALLNWIVQLLGWVCVLCKIDPKDHHRLAEVSEEDMKRVMNTLHLIFLGDDSLSGFPGATDADRKVVEEFINLCGFKCKIQVHTRKDEAVFLGSRPYAAVVGGVEALCWGPTLGRRLYKHHYMLRPEPDQLRWLAGIADFERRAYPHVPFLYEMAVAAGLATTTVHNAWSVDKLVAEGAVNKYKELPLVQDRKDRIVQRSDKVWEQLERIYGFGKEANNALITELIEWAGAGMRLPHMIQSPAVLSAVQQDEK